MNRLVARFGLPAILIGAVCLLVLAAHWPALSAQALLFDDEQYVTKNVLVQNPGWASAGRFFAEVFKPSTVGGYYQPLTMISLMLDYALGGREDNLLPFRITSIAFHTANTALVIALLYMLFGNIWVAAGVGLLFGVHPMTVESIPWMSERKTLLAAFFSFLAVIFYVRFARTDSKKYYAATFLAYLLALMSKPTSLLLPAVMLLMDYWPLNRLSRRAVLEKIPLFVLCFVFAIITLISQSLTAGVQVPGQGPHNLLKVPLIICHNIVFYPGKMLWPANMSSYYEYPQPFGLSNPGVLAGVFGTVILIVLLVLSRRWTKAALTGWLIFFVAILPTMQIVKFSYIIASDKFAYLPSIGLLMMLASFILWLYKGRTRRAISIWVVILLLAGAETVVTRRYLAYWSDTVTLYKYMLSLAPDGAPLYGNLGNAYGKLGRYEDALEEFKRAFSIDPNDSDIHYNLGVTYNHLNRYQQAIESFEQAIRLEPGYIDAFYGLGAAYDALGRYEEVIEVCKHAIKLKPGVAEAYVGLGGAYGKSGRFGESIEAYTQAVKIAPKDVVAHYGLGVALFKNGDRNLALQQYEILRQLDPNAADLLSKIINR